jgi:outer membrane protein
LPLWDFYQFQQFNADYPRVEFQRRTGSMNRLMLLVIFAVLLIPVLGMAQATTPAAAPTSAAAGKLAWMNMETAIISCEEGDKLLKELQKYVDTKAAEVDAMRNELESLKKQLNVQGSKLNDDARAELEDKVEARDTTLQRFQQDAQKDIKARQDRATNYVGKKMLQVIDKVAKEKGYSAVLIYNPNRDAYVDPSLNVTEEIVKAYNQANPAGAASKAPAAAAPAKKP